MSRTVLTRLDLRGVTDLAASLPAPPSDDELDGFEHELLERTSSRVAE